MQELRAKTIEELKLELREKKEELQSVSQELLRGKSKDTSKVKKIRKEIAQIKTVVREKEL